MIKFTIPYAEVQVSNACTLSCQYCTNYSDYNMKGILKSKDFFQWVDSWSSKIKIKTFGFIGGEPLMNPELWDMIEYSRNGFSESTMIVTNVTLWHRWPELLDRIASLKNVHLKFSIHEPNSNYINQAIDSVLSKFDWTITDGPNVPYYFLNKNPSPEDYYNSIKGIDWPSYNNFITKNYSVPDVIAQEIDQFNLIDKLNNLRLNKSDSTNPNKKYVSNTKYFNEEYGLTFSTDITASFVKTWQGDNYHNMKPYNNDPSQAHQLCTQTYCPLLFNGRFYKCSSVALLQNVLADHGLLNDDDWQPYLNYQGIGANDSNEMIEEWMNNYAKPHKICSMCPTLADDPMKNHFDSVKRKIKIYQQRN